MVAHISCLQNFIVEEERRIGGVGGKTEGNIHVLRVGCPKSDDT
jgi:hypothetical protein